MLVLAGLDLGSRLTGWCVGPADRVPTAGAWRFNPSGEDLGATLVALHDGLEALDRDHAPDLIVYEAPIWVRGDKVLKLRKLYSLGPFVEAWALLRARRTGKLIRVQEASVQKLKVELGGRRGADKSAMVDAALRLGVVLPETLAGGREDAADATAAWVWAVRCHARAHQGWIDQALFRARGAML